MSQVDTSERQHRGTWWQRVLVWSLSILLTLLVYWLLGFVLNDIGRLEGPNWTDFEAARLDPALRTAEGELDDEIAEVSRQITNLQRRQQLLRDSTASSQKTLGQLLELQRMSMEQQTTLPEEQQQALADSQRLFLENQRTDQKYNESLAELQERLAELNERQRQHRERLQEARQPLREEFAQLDRRHDLKIAAIKIAVLTPLLLIGAWLFARYRTSTYAPMVYATALALMVRVFQVMHEYFPSEYFRYILILSALAVIGWLLARLLLLVAQPNQAARLKQYREAYEAFLCPICQFPIRRGPLRFMAWTPRSLRKVSRPETTANDEPYTCPSCATLLYEKCPECGAIRHALLPACEHCGAAKEI